MPFSKKDSLIPMSANLIGETLNPTPLYGEGIGATYLWAGGYAFAAAAKFITAILMVLLVQWVGRRGRTIQQKTTGYPRIDLMIRASLPAALYPFILFLLFSAIGNAFVFNNIFGPANLMSLHVDQTPNVDGGLLNPSFFHLSGGLSGVITHHGNNFYPWIIPHMFEYTGIIFLLVGVALLARLEFQNAVLAGIGGFAIACFVFLTYVNTTESHWGEMIPGGLILSITLPVMLFIMAEVKGLVLFGFMATIPIYTGLMYMFGALSSYQLMDYSTDTMFIWETTVYPGLHVVVFFCALLLGNALTSKLTTPIKSAIPTKQFN